MTPVHCFTSFTFSYLSRARVLARTAKAHNPHWTMWALISDEPPPGVEFVLDDEDFDRVVYAKDLEIPDFSSFMFQHDVVEACTAVKGWFLDYLLREQGDKVVYLDPDIAVFHPLAEIEELLDSREIVVTPHQLEPDRHHHAIVDNEICSLRHGVNNLGFLGVAGGTEGRKFARWWKERLLDFCFDNIPHGLFTDQRWCDLIPAFFESYEVLRDPGCNVASWNLSQRRVEITRDGQILVNDSPLKFFHFTKLGPVGEAMTLRYGGDDTAVFELWCWYKTMVVSFHDPRVPPRWWRYGTYADGSPITGAHRRLFQARTDLRRAFSNPFDTGQDTFHEWLRTCDLERELGLLQR